MLEGRSDGSILAEAGERSGWVLHGLSAMTAGVFRGMEWEPASRGPGSRRDFQWTGQAPDRGRGGY